MKLILDALVVRVLKKYVMILQGVELLSLAHQTRIL
jgi:hypothetical protein